MFIFLLSGFSSAHIQLIIMYYYKWKRANILFVVFHFNLFYMTTEKHTNKEEKDRAQVHFGSPHEFILLSLCSLFFFVFSHFICISIYLFLFSSSSHSVLSFVSTMFIYLFIMVDFNCMFRKIYNHINISGLSKRDEMSKRWAVLRFNVQQYISLFSSLFDYDCW